MSRLILAALLWFSFSLSAFAQGGTASRVELSVLPAARTGTVGQDITFFATLLSTSDNDLSCQPSPPAIFGLPQGVTGTLSVFALDGSFAIDGVRNAPFTLPARGRRDVLVVFNLNEEMQGDVEIALGCIGGPSGFEAPRTYPGVNTFRVTVSPTAGPDIVMIGDTVTRDGVARVGQTGPRAALMTVAAVNIGTPGGPFEVYPDLTGFSTLERLDLSICELDAQAACLAPRSDYVTINTWANGEVRLFAVFAPVPEYLGLPFWPDILRLQATVVNAVHTGTDSEISAPASSHREAPAIASTSVAVTGQRTLFWANSGNRDLLFAYPAYQCFSRHDGDFSGRFENRGGVIVLGIPGIDDPTQVDSLGYLWTRDFDRAPYPQPFRLSGFEVIPDGPITIELDLSGVGVANRQQTDVRVPASVTVSDGTSIVIDWTGIPSLDNDFFSDGLARCVALPPATNTARQPDGSPARTVESLNGRYAPPPPLVPVVNPNQDQEGFLLIEDVIDNPLGLGGVLLGQLQNARSFHRNGPEELDVLDAFAGFFAHLGTGGGGSSTGPDRPSANAGLPAGFTIVADPDDLTAVDGPPSCLVILALDGDVSDAGADLDADANIMIYAAAPEGAPVPEVELHHCLP